MQDENVRPGKNAKHHGNQKSDPLNHTRHQQPVMKYKDNSDVTVSSQQENSFGIIESQSRNVLSKSNDVLYKKPCGKCCGIKNCKDKGIENTLVHTCNSKPSDQSLPYSSLSETTISSSQSAYSQSSTDEQSCRVTFVPLEEVLTLTPSFESSQIEHEHRVKNVLVPEQTSQDCPRLREDNSAWKDDLQTTLSETQYSLNLSTLRYVDPDDLLDTSLLYSQTEHRNSEQSISTESFSKQIEEFDSMLNTRILKIVDCELLNSCTTELSLELSETHHQSVKDPISSCDKSAEFTLDTQDQGLKGYSLYDTSSDVEDSQCND